MSKRLVLIIAILLIEAICLIGGVLAAGYGMRRTLTRNAANQAREINQAIGLQFANVIDGFKLKTARKSSEDWRRLQRTVEQFTLPNDGFICVTHSETGEMICHPDIASQPELATKRPGLTPMLNETSDAPIIEQVVSSKSPVGNVTLRDGVHIVAARRLRGLNANVMVHQRMSAIEEQAVENSAPLYRVAGPVVGLILALSGIGTMLLLRQYDTQLEHANSDLESTLDERTRALTNTRNAVIFGLAKLAENRDEDTGEHLDRIREYTTLLAKRLQSYGHDISDQFIADIGLASALHDIGKVGIPDAVLLKPGKLNEEERAIIEKHPIIGCKCLISIEKHLGDDRFLEMATAICLTHHEKWDGNGYPLKLRGANIPLSSRIVAVADVYDALTSQRPYKKPMPHEKAYEIIMNGSGTHFDPDIVAAFDSLYDEFKAIREAYIGEPECLTTSDIFDVSSLRAEMATTVASTS